MLLHSSVVFGTLLRERQEKQLRLTIAACIVATWVLPAVAEDIVLPQDSNVIDVSKPPYNAKGDGVTDDTEAFRKAYQSTGLIYVPNGTYLLTDSIVAPPRVGSAPARRVLQGQSLDKTILKLKDSCEGFGDASKPRPMLKVSWGVAQAFRNGVRNLTIDVGSGNPGAVGVEFFGSNQAGMHHVTIRSGDGKGAVGLSMTGDNGPMLINHVSVRGFDVGIRAAANQSVTMEHIRVSGQNKLGMEVSNKTLVRDFQSDNRVPAVRASGQMFVMLDSACKGATSGVAVEAMGMTYIRNLTVEGYETAVKGKSGQAAGPKVDLWTSAQPVSLFESSGKPLGLAIRETPVVAWGDLKGWADATGGTAAGAGKAPVDVTESLQRAIDSGARTVYFPRGRWTFGEVRVRGAVERIIGLECEIPASDARPRFIVEDGSAAVVVIERFDAQYGKIAVEHASKRELVVSSMALASIVKRPGSGDLFVEDVVTFPLDIEGGNVWARQFNMEHSYDPATEPQPRPNVYNRGGVFWLFGLKTEQNRTKVITTGGSTASGSPPGGGKSEVWAYILANRDSNPQPMFVVDNASMSLTVAESVGRQAPFDVVVRQTQGDQTRELKNAKRPSGSSIALFVAQGGPTSAPATSPQK
jgi:hypothetical protein